MSEENTQEAKALRALARRVNQGLTKLRPVSQAHLVKVREAVRQQWEQTHPGHSPTQATDAGGQARQPAKAKSKTRSQSKPQSRDKSHDHGHSH